MKRNYKIQVMTLIALTSVAGSVRAADFNLPFVSASGLGNVYAGWAASAEDASTAYTNPAGLTLLNGQQLVFAGLGVTGSTQFSGTVTTPDFPSAPPQVGVASSKIKGLLPSFYYSRPIYKNIVFAISSTAPFALGTNYATDSIVRYSATRSQVVAVDTSPSVAYKINDQVSIGLGFDAARLTFTLNQMYGAPLSVPDAQGQNHLAGWAYGWHGGIIYQVLPKTRLGLSFNSMLLFHTTGDSEVFNPDGSEFRTKNQKSNTALPARTNLSINQEINDKLTLMGTVFYTNWSTLYQITMKRTAIPPGELINVSIPFEYHNTFDYALGMNYKVTDKWLVRVGGEYLTAPSNNRDRSVADPVCRGVFLGLGAHYQQNKKLSYDFAYARGIYQTALIRATTPLSSLAGSSSLNTNVIGAQVTWNI
jgi:long-chain fatty acid transport protein